MQTEGHRTAAVARHRGASTGTRRDGFAVMELVVAIALLAIAFAGISTTLASSMSLRRGNQETARAIRAALGVADRLKDEDFATLFATYNEDASDDPLGFDTAPGPNFAVPGLQPLEDDPDGFVGRITFPGDGFDLREDVVARELGMPRDLDGDLTVDAFAHDLDYEVLPVTITLEWQGPRGRDSIRISATMTAR